jgi:hypothetical protein
MNRPLNWAQAKALPWRQRNASVEAATRACLGRLPATSTLSTWDMAALLDPLILKEDRAKLAQILARMAPYLEPLASHDGAAIIRYGRRWKRWQWHGQCKTEQAQQE